MSRAPHSDLLRIATLLRDRALLRHRDDLDDEAMLRAERARIDALRQVARQHEHTPGARQALGMSEAWQGWLLARRGEVQLQIARARARQGHSLLAARTGLARVEAIRRLQAEAHDKGRAAARAVEERSVEHLVQLQRWELTDD